MSHRQVSDTARRDREERASPYSRTNSSAQRPSSGDRWQHDMFQGGQGAVRQSASRGAGGFRKSWEPTPKLLIEGLHWEVVEAELKELFERIGPVSKSFLNYDRSGRSTGTAIVIYGNVQDAEAAKEEYDGANAKGQPITISYAQMRPLRGLAASNGRGGGDDSGPQNLRSRVDLLARLGGERRQAPTNALRGPSASTAQRGSSERGRGGVGAARGTGGLGTGPVGRGGKSRAGGRDNKTKTASELDAELEAFMSANPSDNAKEAVVKADGDMEME